jgi:hypothetical protein
VKRARSAMSALVLAAAILVAPFGLATPAQADTVRSLRVMLAPTVQDWLAELCLQAPSGTGPINAANLNNCSVNIPNQRWTMFRVIQNTYLIVSPSSTCVALTSTGIAMQTCNFSLTNPTHAQRWQLTWDTFGRFQIKRGTVCLGFLINRSDCTSNTDWWWAMPVGFDTTSHVQITSVHSGKCVDADTASPNMERLQQWTCLGAGQTNQMWKLELIQVPMTFDIGYPPLYRLRSKADSSKCITDSNRTANGTRLRVVACSSAMQLRIRSLPGFQWQLMDDLAIDETWDDRRCVDLDTFVGGGHQEGGPIQIWECLADGNSNQTWRFVDVAP